MENTWSWRIPSLLQFLVPFLALPGLIMAPQSPRWLVSMDRTEEARQVLTKWHGGDDADSQLVNYEMIEITTTIQQEKNATSSASYAEMFKTPGNRHRLFISVTLGFFGQWVSLSVSVRAVCTIAHYLCRSVTELSHIIWRLFWKLSASQALPMSL
jgi:hypothetical protein